MFGRAVVRLWLLLALAFGGAQVAQAQNFNFSYTASGVSVVGTFVTTSNNNNTYTITSIINGMRGGNAIALLGPGSFNGNDNLLLYPANSGYLNLNGISYTSGGTRYNTYYSGGGIYSEFDGASTVTAANLMVEAAGAPAPLPGGGLLSFIALGLAALGYHRKTIIGRVRFALARLRPEVVAG